MSLLNDWKEGMVVAKVRQAYCGTPTLSTSRSLVRDLRTPSVKFIPPGSFGFFCFFNLRIYGKDKSLGGEKYKQTLTNCMPK